MLDMKKLLNKLLSAQKLETYDLVNAEYRTGKIVFSKYGKVVCFASSNDFKKLPAGQFITLGTLPEAFRPAVSFYARVANSPTRIVIYIVPSGVVQAFNYETAITSQSNGAVSGAYTTL